MKIKLTANYGKEGFKVWMWTAETWYMDLEMFRIDQHPLGHTTLLISGACGVFFGKEFTTATITSITTTPRRPVAIRAII